MEFLMRSEYSSIWYPLIQQAYPISLITGGSQADDSFRGGLFTSMKPPNPGSKWTPQYPSRLVIRDGRDSLESTEPRHTVVEVSGSGGHVLILSVQGQSCVALYYSASISVRFCSDDWHNVRLHTAKNKIIHPA